MPFSLSRRSLLLSAPVSTLLPAPALVAGPEPLDPLLDQRCKVHPIQKGEAWQALWIWHPGQLTAHLHAAMVQRALARCTDVGYPGRYRQPENYAYFRKRATLPAETRIRWEGPGGRISMFVNGEAIDVTRRSAVLAAGEVELRCEMDFTGSLPCLIVEGAGVATGGGWETSLDRKQWVSAECDPEFNCPHVLPDRKPELTVTIPPRNTPSSFSVPAGKSVLIDFGHDELGQLVFEAAGAGELSVTVGESALEARNTNPVHFEQRALPVTELSAGKRVISLPERCVRFAQFSSTGPAAVSALRLEARVSPVEYKGSFESSDPELNDLWAAGAATLHTNLHDFYLDGIKRDGLCWWDGLLAMEAGDAVFLDAAAARHTIVSLTLPPHPDASDLAIIDTPLYVLPALENDYLVRGDLAFSARYRDRVEDILALFASFQNSDGFVDARQVQTYGFFPDWSTTRETGPDAHGAPAYGQMLVRRAFQIGADFLDRWGDRAQAEVYRAKAAKLGNAIRARFWDPAHSVFLNGIDSRGQLDTRVTRFAQTYAILTDLAPRKDWDALVTGVLNNPAYRPANWSIGQQWEFLAFAKAGVMAPVLERLKRDWGAARRRGYTRFFEDIRPGDDEEHQLYMYRRPFGGSLCHAWAGAAVILALTRGVLGVWPTGPGFSSCRIAPQPCGLKYVRGRVPTPRGPISVEVDGTTVNVELPPDTKVDGHPESGASRSISFDLPRSAKA